MEIRVFGAKEHTCVLETGRLAVLDTDFWLMFSVHYY